MALAADDVVLRIDGQDAASWESYEVTSEILTQPAAFALTFGNSQPARELIAKCGKGKSFQFLVNGRPQFTGRLDGFDASGPPNRITVRGRDLTATLVDDDVRAERSYTDSTYAALVRKALDAVGLGSAPLVSSNATNRQIRTGVPIVELAPPRTVQEIIQGAPGAATNVIAQQIQSKAGESHYAFLKRYLDRAGLFLWSTAEGAFCLSAPNGAQRPAYRILRKYGAAQIVSQIERWEYRDLAIRRFARAVVYGKGGGGEFGWNKYGARFEDADLLAAGITNARVWRDANVSNVQQAAYYARRKMAEANRDGWALSYTVSGHSVMGTANQRAVWAPDTVVAVDDDEIGVSGNYYIEGVTFRGYPQTTTLRLMRIQDLVFGVDS